MATAAALLLQRLASVLLLCLGAAAAGPPITSAKISGHGATGDPSLTLSSGPAPAAGAAAWASYAATYSSIGWDVLNVTTAADAGAQSDAMFAAGYLEGYLTQKAIYASYQNIYSQFFTVHQPPPAKFQMWIDTHMTWVEGAHTRVFIAGTSCPLAVQFLCASDSRSVFSHCDGWIARAGKVAAEKSTDIYWATVGAILAQLRGVAGIRTRVVVIAQRLGL